MQAKLKTITAESCTGGLIAAALSQADGASEFLEGGFVVYTKDSKTRVLGVDKSLLLERSSVCKEVAEQMTWGALERSRATLALAVTGVLGPEPDEDGNPVGLIYLSVCKRGKRPIVTRFMHDTKEADILRRRVTLDALEALYEAAFELKQRANSPS